MNDLYKTWEYEDFLTFALFFAAMSDFIFTEEERVLIDKHCNGEKFKQISSLYKHNSDYENVQILMYFRDTYLKSDEDRQNLKAAVKEMFDSDGVYNILEKTAKRAFDLILR